MKYFIVNRNYHLFFNKKTPTGAGVCNDHILFQGTWIQNTGVVTA